MKIITATRKPTTPGPDEVRIDWTKPITAFNPWPFGGAFHVDGAAYLSPSRGCLVFDGPYCLNSVDHILAVATDGRPVIADPDTLRDQAAVDGYEVDL